MLWNGNECGKTKVMRISSQLSQIQIMVDQRQPEYVEYLDYIGGVITHDARCTREIKSVIAVAKAAFNKKRLFSPANRA
jgi:hypothetical protein